MEQNTDSWLEWRRKGIGASDAPIIMGVSPWKTPHQLWEEKMGLTQSQGSYITEKGHAMEPKAKANFELEQDDDFPTMLAVNTNHNWLRASLDGFNKEKNEIVEIKFSGKEDYENAKKGEVPAKYWPQIQHQLLVTGAKVCHYYSFDGENGVSVPVKPDMDYIEYELFPKLLEFWGLITTKTPPPLTDKDQVIIEDKGLLALADEYIKCDEESKALKKKMDDIKKRLSPAIDHPRAKLGRLAITKAYKKGNIDYENIKELKEVNLERFRKDGTTTVTYRIDKNKK